MPDVPKKSVFDKPAGVVKGDGKEHQTGTGNQTYSSNPTVHAPLAGPEPGFAVRVRSTMSDGTMNTGNDTSAASGITAVLGGAAARRKVVDKAVDEATQ